ncbi:HYPOTHETICAL PROTEIN MCJ_006750 [Mesomycoplasma conjunctivae]|uniref:Uncharacterized protein n=2 Tax=Mesomycoplasma conjunctivae TaxID=45361 RepID=C5J7A6_MESCH|nr:HYPOTHETICAL PROTEIN MCJ_006750 [Mesomycoplasma conjunctivae]
MKGTKMKTLFQKIFLSLFSLATMPLFYSQSNVVFKNINTNFDFQDLDKKLNFIKNESEETRNITIGVIFYSQNKEKDIDVKNLETIIKHYVGNPKIYWTYFQNEDEWFSGIQNLKNQNAEVILHLYETPVFLDQAKFEIDNLNFNFASFLDYISSQTGILHFFSGEKNPKSAILTRFSVFSKTDDKKRLKNQILNSSLAFNLQNSGIVSSQLLVPKLRYKQNNDYKEAVIGYYPTIVVASIFSQLSSSFDIITDLKQHNSMILAALYLSAKTEDNLDFSFNGLHAREGFGIVNFYESFRQLKSNKVKNYHFSGEFHFEDFDLKEGQEINVILLFDNFSQIVKKGQTPFQNIWNFITGFPLFINNKPISIEAQSSNLWNNFDIELEVWRGSWQKVTTANSKLTNFDRLHFKAFENGKYRIKVVSPNFDKKKNSTFVLATQIQNFS